MRGTTVELSQQKHKPLEPITSPLVVCIGDGPQIRDLIVNSRPPQVIAHITPGTSQSISETPGLKINCTHAVQARSPLWGFFISQLAVLPQLQIVTDPSIPKATLDQYLEQIAEAKRLAQMTMGNSIEDTLLGLQYSVQNLPNLAASAGFEALRNKFAGKTILSLATGPALEEALPFLQTHRDQFAMIACESSLPTLTNAGIIPHFVTALEREEIVARYLAQELPHWVTLIAPQLLHPQALKNFKGQTALYPQVFGTGDALKLEFLGPSIETGMSAGNLNISAAIRMGFTKIVMIGHNLALDPKTQESHTKDAFSESKVNLENFTLERPSQDGTTVVLTNRYYDVFRKQIEAEISQYSQIEFINTASKGALIEGACYKPLSEALTDSDEGAIHVRNYLERSLRLPSPTEISERISQAKKSLKLVTKKIDSLITRIFESDRRLARELASLTKGLVPSPQEMARTYETYQKFREEVSRLPETHFAIMACYAQVMKIEQELSALESRGLALEKKFEAYLRGVEKVFNIWKTQLPRIQKILEA